MSLSKKGPLFGHFFADEAVNYMFSFNLTRVFINIRMLNVYTSQMIQKVTRTCLPYLTFEPSSNSLAFVLNLVIKGLIKSACIVIGRCG